MTLIQLLAVALTATALFAFINHSVLRLPTTIGVMVVASVVSLGLAFLNVSGVGLPEWPLELIRSIDFDQTLLHAMLGPLLFAGALFVNLDDLLKQKWTILLFATLGVLFSMFIVAGLVFTVSGILGIELPWIWCLLFGALISPTDPIAVLGILKKLGVPKSLETKFTGESLFNDGVGVVIFIVLLNILAGEGSSPAEIAGLFALEVGGGVLLGFMLGSLVYFMLRRVNNYQVEILLSLALVTGGYAVATALHISGPIFAVIAGLLIGNVGRRYAMSEHSREHLDTFWELVDEILNAVLFMLIGLELLLISFETNVLLLGAIAIAIVLFARFVGLGVLIHALRLRRDFSPHAIKILTWGGLRGGISVALALSLPAGPERTVLLSITCIVVAFAIIVQGLTIGPAIRAAGLGAGNGDKH